ncbi:selenoprotein S-like [Periplaneta americana]|uniref:selenoprotein S-like n=1 Tax=Periplaneta americana TaxID=6978 RepID=UPI0037E8B68B
MDAHVHPETLKETPPEFVTKWLYFGKSFIEQNGWYLLGASLLLYYVWVKLQPYIRKWKEDQEERKFAALCHKYPDFIRTRQESLEVARLRLQMEHDKKAEEHAEKVKERETKKREEYLAKQEGKGPTRLGNRLSDQNSSTDSTSKEQKQPKSTYRPDYNPLMEGGGSGGYRPQRRTCPGGGCG